MTSQAAVCATLTPGQLTLDGKAFWVYAFTGSSIDAFRSYSKLPPNANPLGSTQKNDAALKDLFTRFQKRAGATAPPALQVGPTCRPLLCSSPSTASTLAARTQSL